MSKDDPTLRRFNKAWPALTEKQKRFFYALVCASVDKKHGGLAAKDAKQLDLLLEKRERESERPAQPSQHSAFSSFAWLLAKRVQPPAGPPPKGNEKVNADKTTKKFPHLSDRLARLKQEHEERCRAKGYVFTGSIPTDPESRKLLARLVRELAGL